MRIRPVRLPLRWIWSSLATSPKRSQNQVKYYLAQCSNWDWTGFVKSTLPSVHAKILLFLERNHDLEKDPILFFADSERENYVIIPNPYLCQCIFPTKHLPSVKIRIRNDLPRLDPDPHFGSSHTKNNFMCDDKFWNRFRICIRLACWILIQIRIETNTDR